MSLAEQFAVPMVEACHNLDEPKAKSRTAPPFNPDNSLAPKLVIPAQAGIQLIEKSPRSGSKRCPLRGILFSLDSRLRGNDGANGLFGFSKGGLGGIFADSEYPYSVKSPSVPPLQQTQDRLFQRGKQSAITHHPLRIFTRQLTEGYAWVLLLPSARAGLLLMLTSFAAPMLGVFGLAGATVALLVARWLRADESLVPVYVFNGLLTGLFLAAHYLPTLHFVVLLLLTAQLTGMLCGVFAAALWRFSALPLLSLPFVLAVCCAYFAASSYGVLAPPHAVSYAASSWPVAFFVCLGSIFSQPDPYLGAALFAVMLLTSRTLAFMAALGFAVGMAWQAVLTGGLSAAQMPAWSYNPLLAAMAVGALFVVPGWRSVLLGMLAALMAAFFSVALTMLLAPLGLSALALPFLFASWLCLFAAQRAGRPLPVGERVQLPETTLEETRLARARLGDASSIALSAPFMGEWQVSQECDGAHTHRGIWRNALDFIVTAERFSFQNGGKQLEDFYCFGLPLVSPCSGQVVRVENAIPDNAPGEVNLRENWGNHVLIRVRPGAYVLLAHLRQGSVTVAVGDYLAPGQALGQCGNSGRSPQPHLHLSVVNRELPGAETLPFHLSGVLLRKEDSAAAFHLHCNAELGDRVSAAWSGAVHPLSRKVGQGNVYRVRTAGGDWRDWRITTQLTLDGRFRLLAGSGASCLCEWNGAVFACYGRSGPRDVYFDLWLLAAGYTPASEQAERWSDRPSARLLPGHWLSVFGMLLWPLVTQLEAAYGRSWDAKAKLWRQSGRFSFAGRHALWIDAAIAPENGLAQLRATAAGRQWEMELTGAFQTGDEGVPEREWAVATNLNFGSVR